MQFGGDGVAQLVPAVLELGEAFALELAGDVFEVDADGRQLIEHEPDPPEELSDPPSQP